MHIGGNYQEIAQQGPIRIIVTVSGVVAGAPAWLIPGANVVWSSVVSPFINAINAVYIDVNSLKRRHLTLSYYNNIAANTTFEYQVVQHYEGIPTD